MKKVVLCTPTLLGGGAERFVVDLAIELNKDKNYEIIVAETRISVESFLKQRLIDSGVRIVELSANSYIEMTKKQLIFLKKEKPDVIHANIGSMFHIMLACWILKIPKRIYTVHNEAKLLYGKNKLKKFIYKKAFSFFKFIPVAICPTVKDTIVKDMGINEKSIQVVNNGIDIERFQPNFFKKSEDELKIISVGSFYWIKNQKMMIEAVYNLKNSGKNVSLTLLGDGEDRLSIEKLILDLKAEKYIFVPGIKKDVEKYLKDSDIYISASKTEGLPLSILEGMACGLPVVTTMAGGVKDIVSHKKNGFLVPIDDEEEFEKFISELLENKQEREVFGRESRKIAEQWSLQNCVEGYKKIY